MLFFSCFEHVGRLVLTKITTIIVLHFQHLTPNSIHIGNILKSLGVFPGSGAHSIQPTSRSREIHKLQEF